MSRIESGAARNGTLAMGSYCLALRRRNFPPSIPKNPLAARSPQMLTYATDFPISHTQGATAFLEAVRAWLLASSHTAFQPADLAGLAAADMTDWKATSAHELIRALRVDTPAEQLAAVGYKRQEGDLTWAMSMGFSRQAADTWVSVRVSCDGDRALPQSPAARKPVVVRTLLDRLGGAADGLLQVGEGPVLLGPDDLELAALCLTGQAGCRLPVVFVSAEFAGRWAVDPGALAGALAGVGHVLVEPDRGFSMRIKDATASLNTYGGTIGIYWPDGRGRRTFFRGTLWQTAADLGAAVVDEITATLLTRRPLHRCTWAAVEEAHSHRALAQLRSEGSAEIDLYVAEFDRELQAKDRRLADAEQEILRLHAELQERAITAATAGAAAVPADSLALSPGTEHDLYPGELSGIVADALADAVSRCVLDSRRQHVLSALAAANPPGDAARDRRDRLKTLLRDYRTLDARIERGLHDLGFEIEQDGKHYKLTWQGDPRYVMTLPKSGSDHRGGLNSASDFGRLLF